MKSFSRNLSLALGISLFFILPSTLLAQDTDGDGMPDAWENTHECLMANTADGTVDYDFDGMSSLAEYNYSDLMDPCDPDTEDDGLTDGEEVNNYSTNPLIWDTDWDGLPDNYEVAHLGSIPGLDPLNSGDRLLDPK